MPASALLIAAFKSVADFEIAMPRFTCSSEALKSSPLLEKSSMFAGFTEQECEQFCGYLNRLIANIVTDEFKGRNMFSLILTMTNEKKLHTAKKGEDDL